MDEVKSPTIAVCNGLETILLGTYNYMGMTFDDDVLAAGIEALDTCGAGSTGSRGRKGTYKAGPSTHPTAPTKKMEDLICVAVFFVLEPLPTTSETLFLVGRFSGNDPACWRDGPSCRLPL